MLKIGWAKKEVSTNEPLMIKGQYYVRISKGVLDPLYVTALTMENGGDYVIFLQTDFTGTPDGILKAVCERVTKLNPHIDTDKILMYATHVHTAPILTLNGKCDWCSENLGFPHEEIEIADPVKYTLFFVDMCAKAICESFETRKEGSMAYGYGYACVASHRRVVYDIELSKTEERKEELKRIGTTKMYGNTNLPDFSGFESGADHFSNFMFTFDKNGKPTGVIINIPCPAQCLEIEWYLSADYWGEVRKELQKEFGEDFFVLPQCGAAGDQSPRILHYYKAQDRRYRLKYSSMPVDDRLENFGEIYNIHDIAEKIKDSCLEVYSWAQNEKFDNPTLTHSTKWVYLDRLYVSEEYYNECKERFEDKEGKLAVVHSEDKYRDLKTNTGRLGVKRDMEMIMDRFAEQKTAEKFKTQIHALRIGDVGFCSSQFELYMDYQHRIQARSPFKQTFYIELCAQPHRNSASYLSTKRAAKGKGYSAVMTSCRVSPKGGSELVEETLNELEKIADK